MCRSPWSWVTAPHLNLNGGTMSTDLLWTFVNHHIQPLLRREMTMWMFLRMSCPNHPFSTELHSMEINARIQGILVQGPIKIQALARSL
jgi:hypothetical protein